MRAHRAATRRAQRARRQHLVVGTCTGWCATAADLDDCRRATHDELLTMLGARRRSGVQWTWAQDDAASEHLDILETPPDGHTLPMELSDHYRQVRALLREYGGFVVTAMADAVPA